MTDRVLVIGVVAVSTDLDGPRERTHAELQLLVAVIAAALHAAFVTELRERSARVQLRVLASDEDALREVARERARNIVTGCADLDSHDAWLGVLSALLAATTPTYGRAPLPEGRGELVRLTDRVAGLLAAENPLELPEAA